MIATRSQTKFGATLAPVLRAAWRAGVRAACGFAGGFVATTCVDAWMGRMFSIEKATGFGVLFAVVFALLPLADLTVRGGIFVDRARWRELRERRKTIRNRRRQLHEEFGRRTRN